MIATDHDRPGYIAAIFVVLVYVLSILFNIRLLWGFNAARFLPLWWQWLSIVILALLLVPPLGKKLWTLLEAGSMALSANRTRERVFLAILSIVCLALWLIFNSKGYFLGDATVRLNMIAAGILWVPTEMGDHFIHAIIDRLILEPLGYPVALAYHLVSAMSGVAFLAGAYKLAKYLRPNQSLLIFLLFITSSLGVMFFGYIESYSIVAALIPFVILAGLKAARGESSVIIPIVVFIVAAFMHTIILVLLTGFLMMVLIFPRLNETETKRLNIGLLALMLLGIIIIYVAQYLQYSPASRYFLALFPTENYRMGLFTLNHLLNIVNWIALAGLTGSLIIIIAAFNRAGESKQNLRDKALALWLAIPAAFFMLFFKPHLGGPRDWDLFAPAAFLLIPASLLYYFAKTDRALPVSTVPVIGVSIFILISFASVNASITRATDRFCELIEVSKFKNLFKEYGMMFEFARNTPELNSRALEFGLKAWEQPAYNKQDSLFMANRLAQVYTEKNDYQNSLKFLHLALQADSTDLDTYLRLINLHQAYDRTDILPDIAEKMVALFSNNYQAMLSAGMIYQEAGDMVKSGDAFRRAYQLEPDNPLTALNLGKYLYDSGDLRGSIDILNKIKETDSFAFYAFYYKAMAWYGLRNRQMAANNLSIAEKLAKSPQDRQLINSLKQALNLP